MEGIIMEENNQKTESNVQNQNQEQQQEVKPMFREVPPHSTVAKVIKVCGGIVIGCGVFCVFCVLVCNGTFDGFLGGLAAIVSGFIIFGFGEIISLLYSINKKLDKKDKNE